MLALIMAGGLGTRFWPKSRRKHPKQLLEIIGNRSLIQSTVDRLDGIVPKDRIFVVAAHDQVPQIKLQLGDLPDANFIVEPRQKNTAPCIGLAALFMERVDPDGVMIVCPADHLIYDEKIFNHTLNVARKAAVESDSIVTIGIPPTYAATGYGYIQLADELAQIDGLPLFHVKTFAEKPNQETAQRFLQSGDFLWNSGIFIWKISTILQAIEENLPQIYDGLMDIREAIGTPKQDETINRVYCQIRSISIDYGVMEHAKSVRVLKGDFGWNDLGSWEEIYKLKDKDGSNNVFIGEHAVIDTIGCYVDVPNKLVATVGLEDFIVVDTEDALLICPRERAQEVKDLVDMVKRKKLDQYL